MSYNLTVGAEVGFAASSIRSRSRVCGNLVPMNIRKSNLMQKFLKAVVLNWSGKQSIFFFFFCFAALSLLSKNIRVHMKWQLEAINRTKFWNWSWIWNVILQGHLGWWCSSPHLIVSFFQETCNYLNFLSKWLVHIMI